MKFFILCFLILSSFSLMANEIANEIEYEDVPEEDKQHLSWERCSGWELVSDRTMEQNSNGQWVITPARKRCAKYCRNPRSGEKRVASCSTYPVEIGPPTTIHYNMFRCKGVAETAQAAEAEARNICNFEYRKVWPKEKEKRLGVEQAIRCSPLKICFRVVGTPIFQDSDPPALEPMPAGEKIRCLNCD